jgi:type VII secretion protein EccB
MPSRQDQLHSYQFMVQRVVSALVMRETDPAQSPFRRIAGATLVGVLLAALALGGIAAYSVISPGGSDKWRNDKAVIVEKETGALYVYRDGRLHQVLNYASALLVLSSADVKTVSVSRRSIEGAPRGVPWGIVGAPATLPARGSLRAGSWAVCSHQPVSGTAQSVLFVGAEPPGGRVLGDQAVVLSTSDGTRYLLWNWHKHRIRHADAVLRALVWNSKPPVPVGPAFLNALPAGGDLDVPAVPGVRGAVAKRPAGAKVGQVYQVERGGGGKYDFFAVTPDGLASVTQLQATLLLAQPDTPTLLGQNGALALTPLAYSQATQGTTVRPLVADNGGDGDLPDITPELADVPAGAVCAAAPLSNPSGVRVGVPMPDLAGAVATRSSSADRTVLADRIVVPSGTGAIVRSEASPGAGTGSICIVTDSGRRFTVPSEQVLGTLGYGDRAPVPMPAEVVALLPEGPVLDPSAAQSQPSVD